MREFFHGLRGGSPSIRCAHRRPGKRPASPRRNPIRPALRTRIADTIKEAGCPVLVGLSFSPAHDVIRESLIRKHPDEKVLKDLLYQAQFDDLSPLTADI